MSGSIRGTELWIMRQSLAPTLALFDQSLTALWRDLHTSEDGPIGGAALGKLAVWISKRASGQC